IADPHTAIGIAAARACGPIGIPVIAAATAHPAKFPDAMERAIGVRPSLPERLKDLYQRPEVFLRSSNRLAEVQALVRNFAHRNNA
ncbi:MAG: threonine synthase, partial [Acidiphilium sp.]